jgi:outer membrane receptor protein involved in Fe transport
VHEDGAATDLAGVDNKVRESTVYGEFAIALNPRLEASFGARFTNARLESSGEHLTPLVFAYLSAGEPKRTESRMLPSLALLGRPAEDFTLYARYQEGFRPGGLSIAGNTVRFYRNDRLGTAEFGFRYGRGRRRSFELSGSVTLSQWSDIQADFLDPSGLPATDNIGDGRVWTASLNGAVRVGPNLRLELGSALNDGRITRATAHYRSLAAGRPGSMDIPNIARVIARAALDWRTELGGWALEANAHARYVGRSRLGIGPYLGEEQGQYLDSAIAVRVGRDGRNFTLSLTNLADKAGNRFAFGAPIATGTDQITPLRPRTVRLGFEAAF